MSWIQPTSFNDPESKWVQETFAYDGNTGTQAQDVQTGGSWGPWLQLSFASQNAVNACRFWADFDGSTVDKIQIQVNDATLGWVTVYLGSFNDLTWTEFSFGATYNFTTCQVRFFSITTQNANFYEIEFWQAATPATVSSAVYTGMGNTGELFQSTGGAFTELANQYGSETIVKSMVIDGNSILYAVTNNTGYLLTYDGSGWVALAPKPFPDTFNAWEVVVYNDEIYAAGGGGKLYKYHHGIWQQKAPQLSGQTITTLGVFNNKIYGGTSGGGRLFEWNGTSAWVEVAPQLNAQATIYKLAEFNSKLYGVTSTGGRLFEWNGTNAWVQKAAQYGAQSYLYSLIVFNGKLYAGGNQGQLLEWNGTNAWILKAGVFTDNTALNDMVIFGSELYSGTYDLLKWDGVSAWTKVADRIVTGSPYIEAMAVLDGAPGGGIPKHRRRRWLLGGDAIWASGKIT